MQEALNAAKAMDDRERSRRKFVNNRGWKPLLR